MKYLNLINFFLTVITNLSGPRPIPIYFLLKYITRKRIYEKEKTKWLILKMP